MGIYDDVAACEDALRGLVRSQIGIRWTELFEPEDLATFERKRREDQRARRGTILATDLLDYTEMRHLKDIVLGQRFWPEFKSALGKMKDIRPYFNRLTDLRNVPAHARQLLPFEEDLVRGITGEIRNLVMRHRNGENLASRHWPEIELVTDQFGNRRVGGETGPVDKPEYLFPGDTVTFTCRARDPLEGVMAWTCGSSISHPNFDAASGTEATLIWKVRPEDVNEQSWAIITLTSERGDHRRGDHDATVGFRYFVAPR